MSVAGRELEASVPGRVATPVRSRPGRAVRRYWYPLIMLVRREIAKRYARTMLGASWTVVQPIVLLLIYVGVFAFILPGRGAGGGAASVLYIVTGLLPYLALAEGIQRASLSLREDRSLLDRAEFPAEVIPAARVLSATLNEGVGLVLVLAAAIASGSAPGAWILALPLLIAIRVALATGVAWVVSMLSLFVSDLAEVLSLLLTAWLFLTPIFYRPEDVPAALHWALQINPLHAVVDSYRAVLLEQRAPWPSAALAAAWGTVSLAVGLWFFRRALNRGKDLL